LDEILSQLIEFWQFDLKYRGRRNILNNRNNFILYLLKPTESSSKEKRLEGSMNMSGGKSAPFGTSDNRLSSIALATDGDYPKCRNVTILAEFGGRAARAQWH
jgi:hypothetical protein